ncbi:unnamed protein product [Umbelopsis ramanniana]
MYAPYYNGYGGNPYGYTPSPAPYMYGGGGMNPYSYYGGGGYGGGYPYNSGYGYDYPYYHSRGGMFRGLYGRRYMSPYSSYNYPMVGGYLPMYGSHGNRIYPETNYVSSVKDLWQPGP